MYYIVNKIGLYYCGECWSGCSVWKSHISRAIPFATKQMAKGCKDKLWTNTAKVVFINEENCFKRC